MNKKTFLFTKIKGIGGYRYIRMGIEEFNEEYKLDDILEYTSSNYHIHDSYLKANSVIGRYLRPCCSISGGKDSDIMLDIISKLDGDRRVKYVWFDTGIEYKATKDHLDYLEQKYGIEIIREKAIKPIPTSCKQYGQPFLSKYISEMMSRLQQHNFQWEDDTYENLILKYPKCKSAIAWWTNQRKNNKHGYSQFNINYHRWLKEFIISNPPNFKISNKCCDFAKKQVSKKFVDREQCDLIIVGIRKSEGGIRSAAYKNCFSNNDEKQEVSQYRPLFWYSKADEQEYDKLFNVRHSGCYEVYGLTRTGCVGCPYNIKIEEELSVLEKYEPNLLVAAKNIFGDSYEYTKRYRQYCREHKDCA